MGFHAYSCLPIDRVPEHEFMIDESELWANRPDYALLSECQKL